LLLSVDQWGGIIPSLASGSRMIGLDLTEYAKNIIGLINMDHVRIMGKLFQYKYLMCRSILWYTKNTFFSNPPDEKEKVKTAVSDLCKRYPFFPSSVCKLGYSDFFLGITDDIKFYYQLVEACYAPCFVAVVTKFHHIHEGDIR
jgi:hypothetical protein